MKSDEAAKTLLLRGKEVTFPAEQAERILDLQKRTGLDDYKEPEVKKSAKKLKSTVTDNADLGQPGDTVNPDTSKRAGSKEGSAGQ